MTQTPQNDKKMQHRRFLASAYNAAGRDFMAYRLIHLFKTIKNQDDVVRHNEIFAEIEMICAEHYDSMMRSVADIILNHSKKGH